MIHVDEQEATDVCDMAAALVRTRATLGDVTLYRALVELINESRSRRGRSIEVAEVDHG